MRGGFNNTQHLLGAAGSTQMMGIVGNNVQSIVPTTFADSADIEIDSKKMALSRGSMGGITKDAVNIQEAEIAMQQEIQQTNDGQFIQDDMGGAGQQQ